jgi:hypothetical protein
MRFAMLRTYSGAGNDLSEEKRTYVRRARFEMNTTSAR